MPLYPYHIEGPDDQGAAIVVDSVIGAANVEDAEHFARAEFAKSGGIDVTEFKIVDPEKEEL